MKNHVGLTCLKNKPQIQWFQSRLRNPKNVCTEPHLNDHLGGCAIYSETYM